MIRELCATATATQRKALEAYDVSAQRMTDFAKGRRVPSPAQLVTICTVLQVDPLPYLVALSEQTATPAQRRLIGSGIRTAAAAVLVAVAELCSPTPAQAATTGYGSIKTGFDLHKKTPEITGAATVFSVVTAGPSGVTEWT
jgi:transcriptional regulator with XRE-family HTH domain